jgi:hypothetical protein
MADKTGIEWTEATWNPVTGCSKVSPGCAHCYAERLSMRFGWSRKPWLPEHAEENVVLHKQRHEQPLRWRRPRMISVNSMSDLFHELVPVPFRRRRAKLSTEELIAKMDRLLPKCKQYNEDRKAKVPREKRRGLREYGEFERCYSALRAKGLKLRDARAKTN